MASERLNVVLELIAGQYKREAKAAASATGQIGDAASKTGTATGKLTKQWGGLSKILAGGAAVLAARQMARLAGEAVKLAVDAAEAGSAFATSFGTAEASMQEFVDEFAHMAGFTEGELKQLLAVTGAVVQGIGATEQESADLAQSMAVLAGDVASFSNAAGGAEAVLMALQSAINGEREALKTYGLALSEAEVQQRALQDSGKATASELSRLEKAQATVALAYEKAGKAIGDLERTQDSEANTLRRVNALWKEAKTQIGEELIPALAGILPEVEAAIPAVSELAAALASLAGTAAGEAGGVIGGLADVVSGIELIGAAAGDVVDNFKGARLSALGLIDVWNNTFDEDSGPRQFPLVALLKELRDGLGEGQPAADRLATSLATLGFHGDISADAIERIGRQVGATNDEMEDGLRAAIAYANANGYAESQIMVMVRALLGLETAANEAAGAMEGDASELERLGKMSKTATGQIEPLGSAIWNAARATWDQVAAGESLYGVLKSAADPLFNALGSWRRYSEVLAEVGEEGDRTEEEQLLLAQAYLDAKAAADSFTPESFEAAMQALQTATGKTREEAILLLDSWGLIDGETFSFTIQSNFTSTGTPPGDASVLEALPYVYTGPPPSDGGSGPLEGLAAGGPARAGRTYQVGEGNRPELFMIPGDNGRVISNSDMTSLAAALSGGGGANLTINMQSVEPALDAQRVAAMATVQRMMET